MAANPANVRDTRLLSEAARIVEENTDAPAMLELLRERCDNQPRFPFEDIPTHERTAEQHQAMVSARREWIVDWTARAGALLDKHGRG